MNTTTNYGLKLYEGTDLFNPLTVENVNTGDIDTALKAVSDHAVGAATELTTGTVHALSRSDTDRDVFAFVATSNYESGDTFTLDGTQVSALTPDGQTLATGSYVIGSMVLCALHDTLITVYVNPAKSKDSDKLDGHDSSYFATDSDLDTVAGTIQAVSDKVGTAVLTTTAPDLSGAVNELNTHFTELESFTELATGGVGVTNFTFNESIKNYRYLRIDLSAQYSSGGGTAYIETSELVCVDMLFYVGTAMRKCFGLAGSGYMNFSNVTERSLSVALGEYGTPSGWTNYVHKIYGVK